MTVQITIIGMGQVGTSIGLALAAHTPKIARTGHDKNYQQAKKAERLGALDRVEINLPRSVEKADLVILALPINAIEETLEIIAPDLRPGCVLLDTAPAKTPLLGWTRTHLPPACHYIGLVPALSPNHLSDLERPPHADLFRDGVIGLVHPSGTPGEAIQLASDLVTLLGAEPFFLDITEADSLMASAHLLPQLLSAALLNMTVNQPGWREMRRLAGRPYATASLSAASQDEPAALAQSALGTPEAALRVLDAYIQSLGRLRAAIAAAQADELTGELEKARDGYDKWWAERASGNWQKIEFGTSQPPKKTGLFGNWFGRGKD